MSVLHLNIATFPIQVESLRDRRLLARPVAIAVAERGRVPLLCVSQEAHAAGLRKGMPVGEARRRERRLIVLPPDGALYQRAQKKLCTLMESFTPVYEPSRLGSFFLEMSGTERLFGKPVDAASRLRARLLKEFSLNSTLGVAENKLVSRVAAKLVRPRGLYDVFPGNEADFLKPLEVELLPGLGEVSCRKLFSELGIRRIGQVAEVPLGLLTELFGKRGFDLHQQAQGIDFSAVRILEKTPVLSAAESLSFPANRDEWLKASLWRLVEKLGRELRQRRQMAGCFELKGICADERRLGLRLTLRPPSQNEFHLFRRAEESWEKFYPGRVAVKSLAVVLGELQCEFTQFDWTDDGREGRLLEALDRLREKYGERALRIDKMSPSPIQPKADQPVRGEGRGEG